MGCTCSRIDEGESLGRRQSRQMQQTLQPAPLAQKVTRRSLFGGNVMQLEAMLHLSQDICANYFPGEVSPVMLCSLAVIESCGRYELRELNDEKAEPALGLLQMCYSTAQKLHRQGYSAFSLADPSTLLEPAVALYFGGAHLSALQQRLAGGSVQHSSQSAGSWHHGGQHNTHSSQSQPQHQGWQMPHASWQAAEERLVRNFSGARQGARRGSGGGYWDLYKSVRAKVAHLHESLRGSKRDDDELQMHIVKKGQTLRYISKVSGLTPSDILRANPDLQATPLRSGDCIALPHARVVPVMHVVQRGQSLWAVAQEYEVGLGRLLRANPDVSDVERLPEGSVLQIPGLNSDSVSSISSGASFQLATLPPLFSPFPPSSRLLQGVTPTSVTVLEGPELGGQWPTSSEDSPRGEAGEGPSWGHVAT